MGVPGALQCHIFSPQNGEVSSWSLPVWMIGSISYSVGMGLPMTKPCIVVHARIAQAMNILPNDEVEFEIIEAGKCFTQKVPIMDNINADVIVHGAIFLGITQHESIDGSDSSKLGLKSGKVLCLPIQEMWAGMWVVEMTGLAVLHFDGASQNNLKGPAGYGYYIMTSQGDMLIKGYGYYSSGSNNQMEYKGLLEGLTWALRLNLVTLCIHGDSELVIRQCKNEYEVQDAILKAYHQNVSDHLQESKECRTNISIKHIPREQNELADFLANLGIDSKSHITVCNWANINSLHHQDTPQNLGNLSFWWKKMKMLIFSFHSCGCAPLASGSQKIHYR